MVSRCFPLTRFSSNGGRWYSPCNQDTASIHFILPGTGIFSQRREQNSPRHRTQHVHGPGLADWHHLAPAGGVLLPLDPARSCSQRSMTPPASQVVGLLPFCWPVAPCCFVKLVAVFLSIRIFTVTWTHYHSGLLYQGCITFYMTYCNS